MRVRLWKISRYLKIALASSIRVVPKKRRDRLSAYPTPHVIPSCSHAPLESNQDMLQGGGGSVPAVQTLKNPTYAKNLSKFNGLAVIFMFDNHV